MGILLVVDRIEEDWAVIEYGDGDMVFNMPVALLPRTIKEGDIIELKVSVKREDTLKEKERMDRLLEEHMEDS